MPKLEVPYRSQWAEDAASKDTDCGPTCAAMILNYYGVELSPDQAYEVFSRAFGWHFGRNQFTFTWHLVDLQDHFNVDSGHFTFGNQQAAITKLKAMIDEGRPFIALVNYTPWRNITNINYTGGHFVVVTGYDDEHIMMHDPLFGGNNPESNAHFKMTYSQFAAGWGGFRNPNINPDWHMIFPLSAPRREIADTDKGSSGSEGSNNQPINRVEERPAKKPVELPSEADDETKRRLEALAGWHWREVDWNDGENVLAWTNHLGGFGREVKRHRVKSGENLSVISTRYYGRQDKFKAIMAYNRMDSEMLMVDQWLRIPMPGDDEAHTTLPNLPSILQAAEAAEFFDVETEAAEYESVAENSVGMGATGPETEGAAAPADAADHNLDDSEAAGFSSVPDVVTTNIAVGQTFTGIWTFRNSGTTMWDENYKLVHVPQSLESTGGVPTAQMAAEASYTITELGASAAVLPGETITLSVQFIAPEASEITASHWQLQNGEGENFGALRWISANIVETPDVVQPPPVPEKPEEPAEPEKPEEPVKTTGPGRPFSVFIPMVGHGQQTHTVEFGMNINPNPGGGPQEIDFRDVDIQHQTGLGWVRYAYWASRNQRNSKEAYVKRYRELIKTYADAGIKTLIVLHQDTHWGNGPWDHGGWGIYAAQFAQACAEVARACSEFSDMVAYQIFNETDSRWGDDAPHHNKSAIGIPPEKYALILQAAATSIRTIDPNALIIAGGMKTGPENAVNYLKVVEQTLKKPLPVDALAYHPYGRRASSEFDFVTFGTLTDALVPFKQEFPNLPVWLTEIGVPGHEHVFPPKRYGDIATFMNEAIQEFKDVHSSQVPVIIWFAWSDFSENSGIVTKDGRFKDKIVDAYNAMRNIS